MYLSLLLGVRLICWYCLKRLIHLIVDYHQIEMFVVPVFVARGKIDLLVLFEEAVFEPPD